MGLRRWLVVCFAGLFLVALAGALLLRAVYREVAPDDPTQSPLLFVLTLQFLPFVLRPIVLAGSGVLLFGIGLWRLLSVLLEPFPRREEPLVELIYQRRSLARGPRIVAIGGGTGLSTLLRGLKAHTSNITAIVNVADDGGSSGKLRVELGVAPMGDIRNCIAALADAEPVMTRLLQYRFPDGEEGQGLGGHAFGNLLIAALTATEGDFEEAVRLSNRVLAVRGRVVPAAAVGLTLHARLADGTELVGQSRIARARGIRTVRVTPADPPVPGEALAAIAAADLIVLGPGSLYTSILPSVLPRGLLEALLSASAPCMYVSNVATQLGETEGYGLRDHLAALDAHLPPSLVDIVLANDNLEARTPLNYEATRVQPDVAGDQHGRVRIALADVVDDDNAHHHDPVKLTAAIVSLLESETRERATAVARSA
jgi:uncharacterized cofD-like protein